MAGAEQFLSREEDSSIVYGAVVWLGRLELKSVDSRLPYFLMRSDFDSWLVQGCSVLESLHHRQWRSMQLGDGSAVLRVPESLNLRSTLAGDDNSESGERRTCNRQDRVNIDESEFLVEDGTCSRGRDRRSSGLPDKIFGNRTAECSRVWGCR